MDLNNNPRANAERRAVILRRRLDRVRRIDNSQRDVDWVLHTGDYNVATLAYNEARWHRIYSQVKHELRGCERILRAFKS